ncbi:hypothetical protein LZ31DRAFT_284059 [Colletotrichum somersetense]|nr:hypothetical protein LZ31DRAFT_284059 [Colletotrichum somersetense]
MRHLLPALVPHPCTWLASPPSVGPGSDRARCPQMRLSHSKLCPVLLYPPTHLPTYLPTYLPSYRTVSWRTMAHSP